MVPTAPPAHLIFVHSDVALVGLKLRLDRPASRRCPRLRLGRRLLWRVGKVVARLAPIQVLTIDHPHLFARLPVPAVLATLEREQVGTRSLCSFGHGDRLPSPTWQGARPLAHFLPLPRLRARLGGASSL